MTGQLTLETGHFWDPDPESPAFCRHCDLHRNEHPQPEVIE